jgi:hypothetical protein
MKTIAREQEDIFEVAQQMGRHDVTSGRRALDISRGKWKMATWTDRVLHRLQQLRDADPDCRLYGSSDHGYRLGPRLTPGWLGWLEEHYGIRLPPDYRQFLLEVGNGGAGPCAGLQRFGYLQRPGDIPVSYGTGLLQRTRTPSGRVIEMEERYTPAGVPADPFAELYYEAMMGYAGDDYVRLARPFPLTKAILFPQSGIDPLCEALYEQEITGEWMLADCGCGIMHTLVVVGEKAGTVWVADTANAVGIYPFAGWDKGPEDSEGAAVTFAAWYQGWLDQALEQAGPLGESG